MIDWRVMPHQCAGQFRLVDLAVLDHEQVFARAFGHEAVDVEQQAFVVAVFGGFEVGQDRIRVGARVFRAAHRHVDVMPRERRRLDADAFFERFGAEVGAPRPRGDRHVHGRAFRRHAHFFGAVERDRPDVARFELVRAHDFLVRRHDGFPVVGNFHHVDMRGVEEPLGVLLQPEDRGAARRVVGAQTLEYRESVMQGMGQDMGIRVAPGHELAVIPDVPVTISHRHG